MRLRTILIALTLIALCSTLPGVWFQYSSARTIITQEADNRAASQALIIKDYLSSFLSGSSKAVEAMAADREISHSLVSSDAASLAAANLLLDNFARIFGGGICFLADRDGDIIASSNRRDKTSYVGKSVQYREYFRNAIKGQAWIHMPFGETMAERRIFYSSPIYEAGSVYPVGVAVIKGAINLLERKITLPAGETWVLTDRDGIVYAASNKKLLYRVLWEKTPALAKRINEQLHLGQGPWGWLGMKPISNRTCMDREGKIFRYKKVFVEDSPGWDIIYLTDQGVLMNKFYRRLIGFHIIIPLTLLILVWIVVILMYRRGSSDLLRRRAAESKLQKQNEYMKALGDTTYGLISRTERSKLLEMIISKAGSLLDSENGFLYLYDADTDELEMQYGSGIYTTLTGSRIKPGEGISGKIFASGQYLLIDDYANWEGRLASFDYDALHSVIGFPLNYEGENIGVIGFGHFNVDKQFADEAIDTLERFAKLASIVLYNMRLYERLEKELADRKEAERALRESETRYRDYFHDDLSGAYISRPDGVLVDCNPAFAKVFGFESADDTKSADLRQLYIEKDGRRQFLEQVKAEGRIQNYQSQLRKKDGTAIHVIESAVGVFDAQGELNEIRGYIQDITEQVNLENQLRQALKMEAVGTLAGGIAHDFNNLLMAIEGNASLLRMGLAADDPQGRKLENIQKHVKSGARLTAQLLGYARKGRYEIKTINLNTIVRETAETVGRTNKQVTIAMDLAEDLYPIKVDQGQMEQVLFNLFINAVDAMPDGGTLALNTTNGSETLMAGRMYRPKPGKYVMLTVADNGVGMDPQTQERIFDPFFTTKEMGRGTGLGLASVYGIIKGHTGYIDVDSKPGAGTTFSVCLPASEDIPAFSDQAAAGPVQGQGTVLLVDDEDVIREVGCEYLKVMGYTVQTARGGREALELCSQNYPGIDLVILDMIMPDMGGGEVYDRLKADNADIKVLLSSGYSLDGQASEIVARGCDGFIQKPFGIRELSLKIKEILEN